ncbi:MAG: 50S ribosomal protein L32e [Candidatus Diapherotrites archaeon]|nr:50S ribosomal protein L32e [Candidatus Diapherotrites archaeon]
MVKKSSPKKRKVPTFARQNASEKKRVGSRWRKPRGIDSKQRQQRQEKGAHPRIGYSQPRAIRGMHPTGVREILVNNLAGLEGCAGKAVRIASAVGKRKREGILKKAEEMKLRVLNP